MTPDEFRAWLRAAPSPALLDGGLVAALAADGHNLRPSDPLWTSRLLIDNPSALRTAAERYIAAGADIASTATYQASQAAFATASICHDDAAALMRSAVELTRDAVASAPPARVPCPLVALSLGPYAATLGDGAEYRGYDPGSESEQRLAYFHRRRAHVFFTQCLGEDACQGASADVAAYETFPATSEAVFVTQMMREDDMPGAVLPPFWISFQCRSETQLANGEELDDAVRLVLRVNKGSWGLVALGVNCCNPVWLAGQVKILRRAIEDYAQEASEPRRSVAVAVYANSGETWVDSEGWIWPEGELSEAAWAETVLSAKADLVGGCCRCGFGHVSYIQSALYMRFDNTVPELNASLMHRMKSSLCSTNEANSGLQFSPDCRSSRRARQRRSQRGVARLHRLHNCQGRTYSIYVKTDMTNSVATASYRRRCHPWAVSLIPRETTCKSY